MANVDARIQNRTVADHRWTSTEWYNRVADGSGVRNDRTRATRTEQTRCSFPGGRGVLWAQISPTSSSLAAGESKRIAVTGSSAKSSAEGPTKGAKLVPWNNKNSNQSSDPVDDIMWGGGVGLRQINIIQRCLYADRKISSQGNRIQMRCEALDGRRRGGPPPEKGNKCKLGFYLFKLKVASSLQSGSLALSDRGWGGRWKKSANIYARVNKAGVHSRGGGY